MRILITGATGFIGSHLVDKLLAEGHSVRCLVRGSSSKTWIAGCPVEYSVGDYDDLPSLRKAVAGVEMVYHLAGATKARTKEGYYAANHIATKNMLTAVLEANPSVRRFVHVSSQAAVGPSTDGVAVDEQTPFHPITTYGRSKMEAEKECFAVMDKLPITIIRPPAVYGPRDKDVFMFFETMSRGIQPMMGFNEKRVSLIHVADLVAGIELAAGHPKSAGQAYFISSKKYYSWQEIGDITARAMGKRALRVKIPVWFVYLVASLSEAYGMVTRHPVILNVEKARDITQDAWTCSIAKAERELGFRESMSLEEGVSDTIRWCRKEGWL